MKYTVIKRRNPQKKEEVKFHPYPLKSGIVKSKDIADEIAGRCSLTSGDIMNVFKNLQEILPKYLAMGYNVKLDNIGTFRVTFKTEGSTELDKVDENKIKKIVVHIITDKELRESTEQKMTFEKQLKKF